MNKLIVGIDLCNHCEGALIFAKWFHAHAASHLNSVEARHIIEELQLAQTREYGSYDQLLSHAEFAMKRTLDRSKVGNLFQEIKVETGTTAEDKLEEIAKQSADTLLIIGRTAKRGEDKFVRLGRVARKLLRALPAPTFVTPPDLAPQHIGDGPVLVALDGTDQSLQAFKFARHWAAILGRELMAVHVVPTPEGWGYEYLNTKDVDRIVKELRSDGERVLERWASSHGLSGYRASVRQGVPSREIERVAEEENACFIVTGSRKLGRIERVFVASVGSELAAHSLRTVAIIPDSRSSNADS